MGDFYDTENELKNKESKKEYKNRRDRETSDLQAVLKKPEGRRVIYKILCECGVFKASFSMNSMTTSFNEGKRDVGLSLLAELDLAEPNVYSQMLKEHFSEVKSKQDKSKEDVNV
jgi:hypothetical protein